MTTTWTPTLMVAAPRAPAADAPIERAFVVPRDLRQAVAGMYAAQQAFERQQRLVLAARGAKYDAGIAVDQEKQPAIERCINHGGLTKTDAAKRFDEDGVYRVLDQLYRAASRHCDEREAELSIARHRLETATACVRALTQTGDYE